MIEIRTPQSNSEWQAYYDLRYRVLREPWQQPLGSERNELDAISVHLACFDNDVLVGVLRIDTENTDFAQVRFMAVDTNAQGKGIGKRLMRSAEEKVHLLGYKKIMLQARENALPFYQNLGYKRLEKTHLLFGEIQHWRMERTF